MNWNETSFEGVKGHVLKELYYSLVFATKLTHGKTCQISFFCVLLPCMNTEAVIVSIVFACCAAVHFVGMLVMAILARHRVQYLSLAWLLAIFFGVISIVAMFGDNVADGRPGILNPYMLLMLVVGTYLQSIYSLGIAMPGYLQWGRMWKYASPIVVLALIYVVAMFPAGQLTKVYSLNELLGNIFSLEILLRLAAMFLGLFYVLNIVFLPRRLAYKSGYPMLLLAYTVVLILSVILYLYTALNYTPRLLCAYMVVFTLVNFFWVCHSMETLIVMIPHPDVNMELDDVPDLLEEKEDTSLKLQRQIDFNEVNRNRYLRVQLWMQQNKTKWMENGFTRDKLCEETGINRQLMLQCLRSQGHNNIHEYITTHRVEELKKMILRGDVTSITGCDIVGFGSIQTARSCFLRIEGVSLDAFFSASDRKKSNL